MRPSLAERHAARRAEQARVLEKTTERLIEVLGEHGVTTQLNDTTREQAAHVLGWEGDGDGSAEVHE